jgi:hypothetical protein
LAKELCRLNEVVGDRTVWIDMQSRVRSDADEGKVLDLAKVRACLEASEPYTRAENSLESVPL